MSKQATNLKDAYNNFYFQDPLIFEKKPDSEITQELDSSFYVERPDNPYVELVGSLVSTRHPEKFLFSGHKGSGKSTELNKLAASEEIKKDFYIIKYSIKDELDLNDIQYTDFLITLGIQIYINLEDNGVALKEKTKKKLLAWKKTIETEMNIGGGGETSLGAKIKLPLLDIQGKIKLEGSTRKTIRETQEPKLKILIEIIQDMIFDASIEISPRRLLIIIEDLDKISDLDMAKTLFYSAGPYLAAPRCNAIYTIPISFHYDDTFTSVVSTIGTSCSLPNVKLWERNDPDRKLVQTGINVMSEFVSKRMSLGLIDDDALLEAIRNSGGMMREMGQIMHKACILALTKKHDKITKSIVDDAIGQLRRDYSGLLTKHGVYDLLDSVEKSRIPHGDELALKLLNSKHILEFVNGANDRWYDVHPIVIPLLNRWREFYKKEEKCVSDPSNETQGKD